MEVIIGRTNMFELLTPDIAEPQLNKVCYLEFLHFGNLCFVGARNSQRQDDSK